MQTNSDSCCKGGAEAASCGCDAPEGRRFGLKRLISVVVIVAAMGVGAYSLWSSTRPSGPTTSHRAGMISGGGAR